MVFLSFMACKTTNLPYDEEIFETIVLDTLRVDDIIEPEDNIDNERPVYHASARQVWDLIHTKLEVSFDWENQYLFGKAYLSLKPYFYPSSNIQLDAKGFEIISIKNSTTNKEFKFEYDGYKINIKLDKTYQQNQKVELLVDYIAKPNEGKLGGSAAISSDKGLYFINPKATDPDKPQQIWTQGETEASSKWFPTIDKPNERCTQEIYITVKDKFKTLSNGLLMSSKKNNDGTRTDYWKMDLPHAPYLFMMAIGEYAVIEDKWENIPLTYYVEPKYETSAKKIFSNTPEMLGFFSKITGVKYPWSKYAQIVVRDYVSGAMENTTAVIFGEFVQKTAREINDSNNDLIVAHEMFHHWFGDYVTCESWSNLTLNEGFANYAEYLWTEEKYGKKAADEHKYTELFGYLSSARNGGHDLIHYGYDKKEDMFDAHSYNKGGIVLHMLRDYVGDEAFFASLNRYLTDNAYTAVEVDELRIAFEDTTGEDLNWFFDQWYLDQGYPDLELNHEYLSEQKKYILNISQTQDPEENVAIFKMPVTLRFIYENGKTIDKEIMINQRDQSFEFNDISEDLVTVIFDSKDVLLMIKHEYKTDKEKFYEFMYNNNYLSRITTLREVRDVEYIQAMIEEGLEDDYEGIRIAALNKMIEFPGKDTKKIESMILNDKSTLVKSVALDILSAIDPEISLMMAENILEEANSYRLISMALSIIADNNPKLVLKKAESLEHENAESLNSKIADIYGKYGDISHLGFFKKSISKASKFSVFPQYNYLQKLLFKQNDKDMILANDFLITQSKKLDQSPIKRYLATKTLSLIKEELQSRNKNEVSDFRTKEIKNITDIIIEIKAQEPHERIKSMYDGIN